LVQRELHVARKGDPVAAGGELGADPLEQRPAGGERVRIGRRQLRGAHAAEFTLESPVLMDANLEGKVALVTGAARRLGAAIARRVDDAGAKVVLHHRGSESDAQALEAELNGKRAGSAAREKADLLAPIAPRALVAATLQRFGRLDVLVNNASAFYPTPLGN